MTARYGPYPPIPLVDALLAIEHSLDLARRELTAGAAQIPARDEVEARSVTGRTHMLLATTILYVTAAHHELQIQRGMYRAPAHTNFKPPTFEHYSLRRFGESNLRRLSGFLDFIQRQYDAALVEMPTTELFMPMELALRRSRDATRTADLTARRLLQHLIAARRREQDSAGRL